MATTVTRIVDPDNGAGTDYTSLSAWESGEQGDLTGARDEISVAKCRCTGGTADTTNTDIDGWTTSSTQYIKVWTDTTEAYRHSGKWVTGNKYRMHINSGNVGVLQVQENYTIITGLQFFDTQSSDLGSSTVNITGTDCHFYRNVIKGSSYATGLSPANSTRVYNNVIYDAVTGIGIQNCPYIFNNTIIDCTTGIIGHWIEGSICKNNLVRATTCFSSEFNSASNYNSVSDTTAPGANSRESQTFTFVDNDGDDFHLASTDAGALGYGVSDPGSGLFSDDIDGETRSGSWDIGADEYVAAAATGNPYYAYAQQQ